MVEFFETSRRRISLSGAPVIMGILNLTTDSFSDGGRYTTLDRALKRVEELLSEGADIIDIGGESSRPGAESVSIQEEKARVLPVITEVCSKYDIPVSIDTCKPEIAHCALSEGAEIINDITGLRNERMVEVAIEHNVAVVAMHMRGLPQNMQELAFSEDIFCEVNLFFSDILRLPLGNSKIILDPGIGFGKSLDDNLTLINRINEFETHDRPVLLGISRKSFIGGLTGATSDKRLPGSIAAAVLGFSKGASIFRVHDVAETRQALRVAKAIIEGKQWRKLFISI